MAKETTKTLMVKISLTNGDLYDLHCSDIEMDRNEIRVCNSNGDMVFKYEEIKDMTTVITDDVNFAFTIVCKNHQKLNEKINYE